MIKTDKNKNSTHFPARLTGISIPLGALYTSDCTAIGEYPALAELIPFCTAAGLGIIQLLPVNDTGTQSSPYNGLSAFALHPIYISIKTVPGFDALYTKDTMFASRYDAFTSRYTYTSRYDYNGILNEKMQLLRMIYDSSAVPDLSIWIQERPWVPDYAVFKQLKYKYMQQSWKNWPAEDRTVTRQQITARWNSPELKKEHLFYVWIQYQAYTQFKKAADMIRSAGIILKGDMPIMMNEDSCDAWAHPELFNQELRAGSPPDGDNPLGQNWGFPVYNWANLAENDYSWWKDRLICASAFYGAYRLDHILGFFRIWAVPSPEMTACLGHTEPYSSVSREELHKAGFDDGRIHWLSEPHIPTGVIEDITWNRETAHAILACIADRLGNEELWNFKKNISGDKELSTADFGTVCTGETADRIRQVICTWWRNRCLIEIRKDTFIPSWLYTESVSWKSLNKEEQNALSDIFISIEEKQNKIWKKHASGILKALTSAVPDMVPCGEDLGAVPECVPEVLADTSILGLRVVRWSRLWQEKGQPYIPFKEYTPLSVTTTSVHDSSTIRQWWTEDTAGARLFYTTFLTSPSETLEECITASKTFTPETARNILSAAAGSASVWCIHPLQDFLYMEKKYWQKTAEEERINIPGTVTPFNWTYRIPADIISIRNDSSLIRKIKQISERHTGRSKS